jgi:hypothetical protein
VGGGAPSSSRVALELLGRGTGGRRSSRKQSCAPLHPEYKRPLPLIPGVFKEWWEATSPGSGAPAGGMGCLPGRSGPAPIAARKGASEQVWTDTKKQCSRKESTPPRLLSCNRWRTLCEERGFLWDGDPQWIEQLCPP